ncbi:MAG: hypothetical protein QM760_12470 [Nibricoccus sp.]
MCNRPTRILSLLFILSQTPFATAQLANTAFTPDSREIPVPPIATSLPPLPGPDALSPRPALPDILVADSGQRITSASEWPARRAELRKTLEYYATGAIPSPPGSVRGRELKSSTLLDGDVHYRLVRLSFGPDEKLGFDIAIFTPAKTSGPLPTIIFPSFDPTPGAEKLPALARPPGQGKGVNALLPADAYVPEPAANIPSTPPSTASATTRPTSTPRPDKSSPEVVATAHRALFARGYALVTYHYQDTGEDTTLRQPDGSWSFRTTRQFAAYPGYDWGTAAGWAWGISRVIDFLETENFADKTKLIATGHSRIGKAVLIAGAFDERITLSAPAGSGAGGTAAYRFTGAGRGGKEGLDDMMRKYPNWFSPHLHAFRGQVEKLPFDQHWFIALTAPRAFISLEGADDQNCVPNAVRQSLAGADPAYSLLKATTHPVAHYAPHRHGYDAADWAALLDFADQQLLGKPVTRTFNNFPSE